MTTVATMADSVPTSLRIPELDRRLSPALTRARGWLWALPVLFALHDSEELLFAVRTGGFGDGVGIGPTQTMTEAFTAVFFELALIVLVTAWAGWSLCPGPAMLAYASLLGLYTVHGLLHLALGAAGDGYTMGVATALPLCLVYGGLTYFTLYSAGLLGRRAVWLTLIGGAGLAPVMIVVARLFGAAFA